MLQDRGHRVMLLAVSVGLLLGYIDIHSAHSRWEKPTYLCCGIMLGLLMPVRAWRWGLVLPACLHLVHIWAIAHGYTHPYVESGYFWTLSCWQDVVPATVGAYLGVGISRVWHKHLVPRRVLLDLPDDLPLPASPISLASRKDIAADTASVEAEAIRHAQPPAVNALPLSNPSKRRRLAYRFVAALPWLLYIGITLHTCGHDLGDGGDALSERVRAGDAAGVKALLDSGMDPNDANLLNRHRRALQYAASSGRVDIAEMLIRYGAHVNARDDHDMTALAWTRNETMIALLKRHGAVP